MIYPSSVAGINLTVVKWTVLLALVIGLVVSAYQHGRHVRDGELARVERDTALAYAAEIVTRQQLADGLAEQNATLRQAQAPKDRLITREITRYVEVTKPDQRCTLPGTWRLRHDAAATGLPAGPGTRPLADASADPVEDAAALDTVGENYRSCREAIRQLEGWQRRQRALNARHAESH